MPHDATTDNYAHGMDWGHGDVSIGQLTNYRQYQYDLIGDHMGKDVLEVGSGASRSFTRLIVENNSDLERMLSIEPSPILLDSYQDKGTYQFPEIVEFQNKDIFEIEVEQSGQFDTILFIHVLEHIEDDRAALQHAAKLLKPGGKILIQVPALPFLFSVHDELVGHYRRYTKKIARKAIDTETFDIKRMWYSDMIGILGSLVFFKFRKIKLKSDKGNKVFNKQGRFYDKYLIPFQKRIEKFITPPIGLNLTVILQKR